MDELSRVVVVGAGLAGLRVVEELRRLGYAGHLILIGSEVEPPYDRPPLSKDLLLGTREHSTLRTAEELAALDIELLLGRTATGVSDGVLLLEDMELPYDALVIATGARPRTLPGLEDAHVLRTLDDARRLAGAIRASGRVTVVGGGFIGCEVAATAVAMGASATLVELLPQPMYRVLGAEVSAELAQLHRDAGVDLRLEVAVQSRDPDGSLLLSDGSTIDGTTVVVGLGVVPEVDWLVGSGLDLADGVLADQRGRTSLPSVWALGDVAAWRRPSGEHERVEHWDAARSQATVVARDVLGLGDDPDALAPLDYFWSDQYGLKLQVLGSIRSGDDVTLLRCGQQQRLVAVYGRNGTATAVLGVGVPRKVMTSRGLLIAGAPYDEVVAWVRDASASGTVSDSPR